MNKPNYRQLRAEIQDLSRSRGRSARARERRGDAWRDFDGEEATRDEFEDDESEFPLEDEEYSPFEALSLRASRRPAGSERHTTRALQRIAELVDDSRNNRSRGLDHALDALSRSITASERRTAKALETIVAELIEEDSYAPAAERRRRRVRRPSGEAPARNLAPEPDEDIDDLDAVAKEFADRLEGEDAADGHRAEANSSVVKAPLAEAILDITRRQHALDASADDFDERPATVSADFGAGRLEEIERAIAAMAKTIESRLADREARPEIASELGAEIDKLRRQVEETTREEHPALARRFGEMREDMEALERQLGSLRGDLDNSAERERHIMLQVDGLREEIRSLTRGVGELAPRASVEAIERALSDLAERVGAQRAKGVEDEALAPAERIAGELRAVLQDLDARPHMRELDADVRALAERLDRLDASNDSDRASLAELSQRTAEIKEALSSLTARPLPQEQIETRVRDLTIRVDKLTSGPASENRSSDVIDAATAIRTVLSTETGLDAFNQRLDRLSAKLGEALVQFDGSRFEELGARIDEMHFSLAQRIDEGMSQAFPNVAALKGLLGDLAKKVDRALSAGEAAGAVLEGKVDRLDEKLDRLGAGPFAEQLEELLERAKPREDDRLAEIADRLEVVQRTLESQIDESAQSRKDDTHKTQLSALLEQLANRSAEAFGPGADPAAVNALSEQVRQLSARLDRTLNDSAMLASIERRIAELCEKIESTRAGTAAPAVRRQAEAAPPPSLELQLDALDEILEARETVRASEAIPAEQEHDTATGPASDVSWSASSEGNVEPTRESWLLDDPTPPAAGALVKPPAPQGRKRRQDVNAGGSRASTGLLPAGIDLELKQQADFIAAARRAAERAGVEPLPPRDRKISIKELPAGRASSANGETFAAEPKPSRKNLIIAGLTGVALIAAAAPIARMAYDQTLGFSGQEAQATGEDGSSGGSQKFALNVPPSLMQKLGAPGAAETNAASEGAGAEAAKAPGVAASAATERVDTTPVGAIEKARPVSPQDTASLQTLAERGDARAQFELGVRYAEGRGGLPRDAKVAAQWFSKASDQNLALAQYRLGSFYEKGVGVDRDTERARNLYEKAAAAGNARAMHNLGVLFVENGDGWPDYASAAGWFRKAAEFGVRDSQFNLAVLYVRGMGVQQNLVQAYMWFSVAAAQGDPEAARKRDDVAARLDPRDLVTAKSMVDGFKPKELARDANEIESPRSASPSRNPSDKQPDAPTARATSLNRPKMSRN